MRAAYLLIPVIGLMAGGAAFVKPRRTPDQVRPAPAAVSVPASPTVPAATASPPAPAAELRPAPFARLVRRPMLGRQPSWMEVCIDESARQADSIHLDPASMDTENMPAARPLVVTEHMSGCILSGDQVRSFAAMDEEFVDADGAILSAADVEELRARVLASRPGPGESATEILRSPGDYLESLGFSDDVIARHVPALRRLCAGDWKDQKGEPLEQHAVLDELFEIDHLKHVLVDHLLRAPDRSTTTYQTVIELPGEPRIFLGTESNSPDLIPWYVVAGGERWYLLDRELSRALVDLGPEQGWIRSCFEHTEDWRSTIWSDLVVWYALVPASNAALARVSYQLVPGWERVEARYKVGEPSQPRPGSPRLPRLDLGVRKTGTIDRVLLRPGSQCYSDWNDVLADQARAEQAVSAQPWLARWKGATGRRGLSLVLLSDVEACLDESSVYELWEDLALEGAPEFILVFEGVGKIQGRQVHHGVGRGVLSTQGTLLILNSSGVRGPLSGAVPPITRFQDTGRYGLVLPGGELEIRTPKR